MTVAIRIENVSKLYRLGTVGTGTLSHDINRWWHRIRGKEDPYAKIGQVNDRTAKSSAASGQSSETAAAENGQLKTADSRASGPEYVWALKDINLEVAQGEILGIIGRNGAGKSTLLKLLSRVTAPTTGSIKTRGRIASLLEVGTGFHPELTGRENIYLNGTLLGMSRSDIRARFDAIMDFAAVEKYIDTPVKRYSSGMTVRLGFAVAAHLGSDILIVDEVLAVGDIEFQKRCLGKMNEVADSGRTVLFVSHNIGAVRHLTTRSIVLEHGSVTYSGDTESAVGVYSSRNRAAAQKNSTGRRQVPYAGEGVQFDDIRLRKQQPFFDPDEPLVFDVSLRSSTKDGFVRISLTLFRGDGTAVGSCFSDEAIKVCPQATTNVAVKLSDHRLAPGAYYFAVSVGTGDNTTGLRDFDSVTDVLHFEVARQAMGNNGGATWHSGWGAIQLPVPHVSVAGLKRSGT